MANDVPPWIQTLITGILLIAALFMMLWFLDTYANPETANNVTSSILKRGLLLLK
ncbi:MAG: hypothetical protein V1660_03140 [archaeon]